ncbi:hypothetical protein F5Y16DRAFT_403643 [Xylariaceae sp. FL0255]|nr:hypothetical protein F5Y16DRAFT_403643 [Xylariaceae sp. FL0255]
MGANSTIGGDGSTSETNKPSFTEFWKRSKEQQAPKSLTFVSSSLEQPPVTKIQKAKGKQSASSAQTKSQARRQQVRRAQIQHRQRKVNYTQKLEEDAAKLREDIAKVEEDIVNLRKSNDAIRYHLILKGQASATPVNNIITPTSATTVNSSPLYASTMPSPLPATASPMDLTYPAHASPGYTISLDMADDLSNPIWQVSRPSPLSSGGGSAIHSPRPTTTPATTVSQGTSTHIGDAATAEMALSDEQTEQVINFILALEHVCWGHTHHIHEKPFHHPIPTISPERSDWDYMNDDQENGHLLTATALALNTAPGETKKMIDEFHSELIHEKALLQHLCNTNTPITDFASSSSANVPSRIAPTGPGSNPAFFAPEPTVNLASFTRHNKLAQQLHSQLQWPARSLTLANLRELAATLNPPGAELAPVQAWFEVARRFGTGVATDMSVLETLRREFGAVVRCVRFGAALTREAFEEILERVLPQSLLRVGSGGNASLSVNSVDERASSENLGENNTSGMEVGAGTGTDGGGGAVVGGWDVGGVGNEFTEFWRFDEWSDWDWGAGGGWGGVVEDNEDFEMGEGEGGDDGNSSKSGGKARLFRRLMNSAMGKGGSSSGGGGDGGQGF